MTFDLQSDLALAGLGLTVKHSFEKCAHDVCKMFDRRFDADALATGRTGRPVFIAWREQDDYDYPTITVRASSDNGNDDVQLAKLMDRRSLATLYVQSYPSRVVWATTRALREAITAHRCIHHEDLQPGKGGQLFRIVCERCTAEAAGLTIVPRQAPHPAYDLISDPEFIAAWDAAQAAMRP